MDGEVTEYGAKECGSALDADGLNGHRCGPGECRQGVYGIAAGPKLRQNNGARRTTRLRAPDSDDAAGRTKGF